MADPQTVNIGLFVPNTGADVDTWGANALNPDFVALDGVLAGVQIIGATNAPITLTSPAGFVATPGPGPTQSQNRVLRFTGVLTGNVRVTLPLPGSYLIDNRTTGAFVLSFQGVTATEVVGIDQGSIVEIYNDGSNVRFVNLGKVGALEFWGGVIAIPAWVAACTVRPYLLSDGSVYNFVDYPWLAAKYVGSFGGNGVTTFGVQDLQGRMPLAYDGTGARITTAGCGINGQTMGAAGGSQNVGILQTDLPNVTVQLAGTVTVTSVSAQVKTGAYVASTFTSGPGGGILYNDNASAFGSINSTGNLATAGSTSSLNGGVIQTLQRNIPPTQVSGIWVVKT